MLIANYILLVYIFSYGAGLLFYSEKNSTLNTVFKKIFEMSSIFLFANNILVLVNPNFTPYEDWKMSFVTLSFTVLLCLFRISNRK